MIKVEDRLTEPPAKMTETELLGLMEKYHIGTDASMATHISNVIDRQYVNVEGKNRTLVATSLGNTLYNFYMNMDKDLI